MYIAARQLLRVGFLHFYYGVIRLMYIASIIVLQTIYLDIIFILCTLTAFKEKKEINKIRFFILIKKNTR